MPVRYHAQRQHIIRSLNNVLFQLHTISFFLAPALFPYLARLFLQLHFFHPRETDPGLSLRLWFLILGVVNFISVWTHATTNPPQPSERSVILDFVGPAGVAPTRLHLLLLDLAIIALNVILISIAYETAVYAASPKDAPDPLLPALIPSPSPSRSRSPSLSQSSDFNMSPSASTTDLPHPYNYPPKPPSHSHSHSHSHLHARRPSSSLHEPEYVLDLHLSTIYRRLRDPPPPPPDRSGDELLPLPNTTGLSAIQTVQMILRARARAQALRERQETERRTRRDRERERDRDRERERERRRGRARDGSRLDEMEMSPLNADGERTGSGSAAGTGAGTSMPGGFALDDVEARGESS